MKIKDRDKNARFASELRENGFATLRNVKLEDSIGPIKLAVALGCYPVCEEASEVRPGVYDLKIVDAGSEEQQEKYVRDLLEGES